MLNLSQFWWYNMLNIHFLLSPFKESKTVCCIPGVSPYIWCDLTLQTLIMSRDEPQGVDCHFYELIKLHCLDLWFDFNLSLLWGVETSWEIVVRINQGKMLQSFRFVWINSVNHWLRIWKLPNSFVIWAKQFKNGMLNKMYFDLWSS